MAIGTNFTTVTIQPNQSLIDIAKANGTNIKTILAANNNLRNLAFVAEGTKIRVPQEPQVVGSAVSPSIFSA